MRSTIYDKKGCDPTLAGGSDLSLLRGIVLPTTKRTNVDLATVLGVTLSSFNFYYFSTFNKIIAYTSWKYILFLYP